MSEVPLVTIRGVLHLFSETGTEGAYWAFQDVRFTGIPDPDTFCCKKCGRVWDKKRNPQVPKRELDDECDHPKDHKWELSNPDGSWLYEGLHVLSNGDLLTVFDKEQHEKVLWSGEILLDPPYIGGAHLGLGVHCYQSGVFHEEWQKWFEGQHPAAITLGPTSLIDWGRWKKAWVETKLKELGKE